MKNTLKKIDNGISYFFIALLILCYVVLKPLHYAVCAIFNLLNKQLNDLIDDICKNE